MLGFFQMLLVHYCCCCCGRLCWLFLPPQRSPYFSNSFAAKVEVGFKETVDLLPSTVTPNATCRYGFDIDVSLWKAFLTVGGGSQFEDSSVLLRAEDIQQAARECLTSETVRAKRLRICLNKKFVEYIRNSLKLTLLFVVFVTHSYILYSGTPWILTSISDLILQQLAWSLFR